MSDENIITKKLPSDESSLNSVWQIGIGIYKRGFNSLYLWSVLLPFMVIKNFIPTVFNAFGDKFKLTFSINTGILFPNPALVKGRYRCVVFGNKL